MDELIVRLQERTKAASRRTDSEDLIKPIVHPPLDLNQVAVAEENWGSRFPSPSGGSTPRSVTVASVPVTASSAFSVEPESMGTTIRSTFYKTFRGSDSSDPAWSWPRVSASHLELGMCDPLLRRLLKTPCAHRAFDPNPIDEGGDWSIAFNPERDSFEEWLRDWLDGQLSFEDHLATGERAPT